MRALTLLIAALAVFRIAALAVNGTELFVDESQYWSWSLAPAFGYFSKPPLVAWLIGASTAVCGNGEFCIRLPALLLNLGTSIVLYFLGRRLFDARVGFWSALTFATLPVISLSSAIMSTDAPLLFAWAVALLAFAHLARTENPRISAAIGLGIAIGLGLNAKYAMGYFVLCIGVYLILAPSRRPLLRRPHLWIALAIALALIAPNLIWNATHGFATFAHTASNAHWTGSLFHPDQALEFLASQFAIFGPVLFIALLLVTWQGRWSFRRLGEADRLLIAFSVPIILLMVIQGLLSTSNANWALTAYVSGTVLVVSRLVRPGLTGWLKASTALHVAFAIVFALAEWQAASFILPGGTNPFARVLGSRGLAAEMRSTLATSPYASILTNSRSDTAALLYYGRDLQQPLYVWRADAAPANHFELTRPFTARSPTPSLFLSSTDDVSGIAEHFTTVKPLGARTIQIDQFSTRTVYLYALSGYDGS